ETEVEGFCDFAVGASSGDEAEYFELAGAAFVRRVHRARRSLLVRAVRVGAENSVRLSPEARSRLCSDTPCTPRVSLVSAYRPVSRARAYQTVSSLARWIGSPRR